MMSMVYKTIKRIPLRKLFLLGLFVPIFPILVNIYYIDEESHVASQMCSPWFPSYSKILDLPIVRADGGIQTADWTYPPDAVWQAHGLWRGCPCSVGPCIRPCCPLGTIFAGIGDTRPLCHFNDDYSKYENTTITVASSSDPLEPVTVSGKHFSILSAGCISNVYKIDATIAENGKLWIMRDTFEVEEAYRTFLCFRVVEEVLTNSWVFMCYESVQADIQAVSRREHVAMALTLLVSSVLLLISLVVYALVPRLHAADYGKSIMSYVLVLLVVKIRYVLEIWRVAYRHVDADPQYLALSWGNLILLWQLAIVCQMWSVFKPGKLQVPKSEGNTKFICFSALCWGLGVLGFVIQHFFPDNPVIEHIQTAVSTVTCCLNIATIRRVNVSLKSSKQIQGPDSKRHNVKEYEWASVFLKVSLVTGLDFSIGSLINHLSLYINGKVLGINSWLRFVGSLHAYLNNLKGVEIFFFNVWQKEVFGALQKRFLNK